MTLSNSKNTTAPFALTCVLVDKYPLGRLTLSPYVQPTVETLSQMVRNNA